MEQQTDIGQDISKEDVAAYIAEQLGETDEGARKSILGIVRAAGRTHAKELLNMTLQTEEHGGLMLPDGSRRRTPGGVFFHYAYTIGKAKSGNPLRPVGNQKAKKPSVQVSKPKNTNTSQMPIEKPVSISAMAFSWEDRIGVIKEAEQEKGQANVKMTVIGRPGKIIDKGGCIVTVMESSKVPALPKGLPTPTEVATKYVVYIASKQWKKVEEAIKDPEDSLIIEGFPKIDQEMSAIAVFSSNVTTKKLQMAKKQPQAAH